MESYLIVFAVALFASILGFFSGFGLGTLLLPAMLLVLPPEVAVAATALVHFANNILKVSLLWRQANGGIVARFGVPAILAAFLGAWVLTLVAAESGMLSYSLFGIDVEIAPVKALLAGLIFLFALADLLPGLRSLKVDPRYLPFGGAISGFFGGLSGHQGALRSAFLIKTGIEPKAFVATNACIGFLVDAARIAVYSSVMVPAFRAGAGGTAWQLVMVAIAGAFLGVLTGRKYIHKTTIQGLQTLVGVLLLIIALALGLGLI